MSATSPYAMRVMQETPMHVRSNASADVLTRVETRMGWDTPISGDMLALSTTYTDNPTTGTMDLALHVLPTLTTEQVTTYLAEQNANPDPDLTADRDATNLGPRRFAIGAISPMWGDLGHHVTYITDGDVFTHYPSDPTSRITYAGRQVIE